MNDILERAESILLGRGGLTVEEVKYFQAMLSAESEARRLTVLSACCE